MHWLTLLMRKFGWPPPAVVVPVRPRRLRIRCDTCGKTVAVVRSTGKCWKHACEPIPEEERDPEEGPRSQFDTWEEYRGER